MTFAISRGPEHDPAHDQWMSDLIDLAAACGPKTLDQLVQAASAKQAQQDPSAVKAAVDAYAKAFSGPNINSPEQLQAKENLAAAGNAAFVPLCDVIATNDAARPAATSGIFQLMGFGSRGKQTDIDAVRERLINAVPPPIFPLDAKQKAAVTKALPALIAQADKVKDTHNLPAEFSILIDISPDVPHAAEAVLERLDRVPPQCRGDAVDALVHADKSVLAKAPALLPGQIARSRFSDGFTSGSFPLIKASLNC